MLYNALGAEAVLALLRLWGGAQISREWQGLDLSPKKLKAICGFPGCEQKLWDAFTDPDFPWLDLAQDGTYSIHGFEEHQAQVIALWKNGQKGGRPPKPKTNPPLSHPPTHPLTPHGSHAVSPIKPNGNHLVSDGFALNGASSASPPDISWSSAGGFTGITDQDRESWTKAYPAVNIDRQLAAASEWLKSNPAKAKKSLWRRFITGWLSRQQERGGDITSNRPLLAPEGTVVVNGRVFKS